MHAIILVAGRGHRLAPFTASAPKCMVPVGGQPLLTSTLSALAGAGITCTTLVVGHLHGVVRRHYGDAFAGMVLRYAHNPDYLTTSNLVSLWLARNAMDRDVLLIEGDVLFHPTIASRLVHHPASDVAVVDTFRPGMDGTAIVPGGGDRAHALVLKRDQKAGFTTCGAMKTVNMYKLSWRTVRQWVLPRLEAALVHDDPRDYYERVLGELVAEGRLDLALLRAERPWVEIDDVWDWHLAESVFGLRTAATHQHTSPERATTPFGAGAAHRSASALTGD